MFAHIKDSVYNKFKYCPKSTENMQKIFGDDIVKRVFVACSQFHDAGIVGKDGSWDAMQLIVELSNGRYISMGNSEWAGFSHEKKVTIK